MEDKLKELTKCLMHWIPERQNETTARINAMAIVCELTAEAERAELARLRAERKAAAK